MTRERLSSIELVPQKGDVWGYPPRMAEAFSTEFRVLKPEQYPVAPYERLIERDGKRGERLWSHFTYGECPQWRKDELKQAHKLEFRVYNHNNWSPVNDDKTLVDRWYYRIKAEEEKPDQLTTKSRFVANMTPDKIQKPDPYVPMCCDMSKLKHYTTEALGWQIIHL